MLKRFLAFSVLSLLAACAPKRIPGTDIVDNSDTRAILAVMEQYRTALEARDAQAIQKLVSPSFQDDGGTPSDPSDDLTAETLVPYLEKVFPRIQGPRIELSIRRIQVGEGVAAAIYYWNASWRMPSLHSRPMKESELEQMVLRKEDGTWKIVTGI
ncbi:nuclear transport factor 2 family protein [Corallococcus macrosporus]|uniref:DUF4440 domain-containing protein n=1 Tax=Corallococcus macrosporus DSM 14697 TaxID=1189310 RepID=A0A250JT84_9BACT|nr:nuclear transport factor 2 family protein [Corallococcus macrosporus]ATB46878.1 hypothetical protein MYMAC_002483 [Corallococcus macrosporus DSM 14697]